MASTANKKFLTDENGDEFYPIGHVDAIYDANGNILGDMMNEGWGAKWYTGTAMSGTTTTTDYYSYSACPLVKLGDMYINTTTGGIYECTTAGSGTTAKWTYKGCIKGAAADESKLTAAQNDIIMYVCAMANTMTGSAKTSFENHMKSVLSSSKYYADVTRAEAGDLFGYISIYDGNGGYTLPEDEILYIPLSSLSNKDSVNINHLWCEDSNQMWDIRNSLTDAITTVSITATAFAVRIRRDKCHLLYVW